MRKNFINEIICLECRQSNFDVYPVKENEINIEQGHILCRQCGSVYPISNSVPILFPNKILTYFLTPEEKVFCKEIGIDNILAKKHDKNFKSAKVVKMFDMYMFTFPKFQKKDQMVIDPLHHSKQQFLNFNHISEEDYHNKDILVAGGDMAGKLLS